jgi:hypothetical protein
MKFCVMIFAASACWAQLWSDPAPPKIDGTPNNNWDRGGNISPAGALENVSYCAWTTDQDGIQRAEPDVTVQIGGYWTLASGYHSHEVFSGYRPRFTLGDTPAVQLTGADGCAYWNVNIPPFSGYVTLYGVPNRGFPVRGLNSYAGIFLSDWLNSFRNAGVVAQSTVNTYQRDQSHSGAVFWVNHYVYENLYNALDGYYASTATKDENGNELFPGDKARLVRASLAPGGTLDDQTYWPYWWSAPVNEWHYIGSEIDIKNPINYSQLGYYSWFDTLVNNMEANHCDLGLLQQGVDLRVPFDLRTYWKTLDNLHFACTVIPKQRN